MTLDDLQAIADAEESLRAQWAAALTARVTRAVADAHAHAVKAVTDALQATADGRPTLRRANRSPSFQAALARLDELWTWLAGPSRTSLDGTVRDARAAAYRLAFRLHTPHIPGELRVRPNPEPTGAALDQVRAFPLHGYDVRTELDGPIAAAKRQLAAAVALAGARGVTATAEASLLDAWRTRTTAALSRTVLTLVSDSVEFADGQARRDLIHPDYRDDTPVESEG